MKAEWKAEATRRGVKVKALTNRITGEISYELFRQGIKVATFSKAGLFTYLFPEKAERMCERGEMLV